MTEIVIKIPEDDYQFIKDIGFENYAVTEHLYDAVYKGILLPKGHGRLGDLDALHNEVSSWGMNDYEPSDFTAEIDEAPTIIEADAKNYK